MRIVVIGAGSAGLAAIKNCASDLYDNVEVVCYEKTDQIGGTWVYREETGLDRYGLRIHTSMYDNLRTNLPKEVMGYPDFPVPEMDKSFMTRSQTLRFLNSYCDRFNLRRFIRFLHDVELVEPSNRRWILKVRDLETDEVLIESFDAVVVCNGHFFEPNVPTLNGRDVFQGQQMHSHDYRVANVFRGKIVVVIGAGPSRLDLTLDISRQAKRVLFSHHMKDPRHGTVFPKNVTEKPDIERLTEHNVIFEDGTSETVDVIFYCTGYKYSFPFLSEKCGVRVDCNMVTPLWKHLISIENPTLAFVGLPSHVCAFNMFDLQVRFILEYWSNRRDFPSKERMSRDEAEELAARLKDGARKRHFHVMGVNQGRYYEDLATTASVKPLPPVLSKLFKECNAQILRDLLSYRERRYRIVDDENFEVVEN